MMPDWATYEFNLKIITLPIFGSANQYPVRRVYCVGRNYVEHIREMKEGDERDPPFFFQKPTDAVVTNKGPLPYPAYTEDFQYELELVVAIGRGGRSISVDAALGHVFGYAIGFDMTRRDRQREARDKRLPWEMGKSFDQSAPCGAIHRATDIGHPNAGGINLSVNGVARQNGDLSQMIWNVPEIIANLSTQYELFAGDLIFTGTPAGVGPVKPGDQMSGQIAGLETLTIDIGPRSS
jgi:fumarylpyruvate hydrolase